MTEQEEILYKLVYKVIKLTISHLQIQVCLEQTQKLSKVFNIEHHFFNQGDNRFRNSDMTNMING